jgi:hypothetical protein
MTDNETRRAHHILATHIAMIEAVGISLIPLPLIDAVWHRLSQTAHLN